MGFKTLLPAALLTIILGTYSCTSGGGGGGSSGGSTPPASNDPGDDPNPIALCMNGIDDDGDDLIDMLDPGCSSEDDNDETDPAIPLPDFTVKQDYFDTGIFTGDTTGLDAILGTPNNENGITFKLTSADFKNIYNDSFDVRSSLIDIITTYINAGYNNPSETDIATSISTAMNNLEGNTVDQIRLLNNFAVYGGTDTEGNKFVAFHIIDENGTISYAFLKDEDEFDDGEGTAYGVSEFYAALDASCASTEEVINSLKQGYLLDNSINYQSGKEQIIPSETGTTGITPDLYLTDLDMAIWYLDGTEDPVEIERQRQACKWFQTYILPSFNYSFVVKTSNAEPDRSAENELIDIIEG